MSAEFILVTPKYQSQKKSLPSIFVVGRTSNLRTVQGVSGKFRDKGSKHFICKKIYNLCSHPSK